MQQETAPGRAGTREFPLAAPLCVLLAQTQNLIADTAKLRELIGQNPVMLLQLAYLMAQGASPSQERTSLLKPDPALLLELLVARLSRRAVMATLESEERLMRDWQRQQQCWQLTTIAARLLNMAEPENAGLAAIYCLLDDDLAKVLPVPALWQDLRATVHQNADDLRDTALLSRLVWCCVRLQRNNLRLDENLLAACQELLGWQEQRLRALVEEAQVALLQRSKSLGLGAALDTIGQDPVRAENWLQELKLQAVRFITQASHQLALQAKAPTSEAELQVAIRQLLLRHQLPLQFALLQASVDGKQLQVQTTTGSEDLRLLSLPLASSRSLFASLVQQGMTAKVRSNDAGLAPSDRQLLRVAAWESVLCLPLPGERIAALLLPDASPDNGELPALARSVALLLARQAGGAAKNTTNAEEVAVIHQQVRELVHEVNNPLAIIKNYLQLLQLKYPAEQSAREEIKHIDSEIDRVGRLLQSFRHNITASNEVGELDLNELVRSQHRWLSAAFAGKPGLQLQLVPTTEPAVVMGSRAALTQILLNLMKNAAEALGENGKISLNLKRNVHWQGALHVLLEVRDDGPGLESWQMLSLFQGQGSTKGDAERGSGLRIVKKLMDELGGQISCHSDSNGTTFSLLFPQVR